MQMSEEKNPLKKMLGTSNYFARMTFHYNRKKYTPNLKVTLEIFFGRNRDGVFELDNITEVAKKLRSFYEEKSGMPLEDRRLSRWIIEYFEESNLVPPELNIILRDIQSSPSEIEAREGTPQ